LLVSKRFGKVLFTVVLLALAGFALWTGVYHQQARSSAQDINLLEILNFLDYNRQTLEGLPNLSFDYIWTMDAYDVLKVSVPNRTRAIEYLDGVQNVDGTWGSGINVMYVTSQVLMFYSRSGAVPAKSLEHLFSSINTWDEVLACVDKNGSGNFWGYFYLIINSYVAYKGLPPPWESQFLDLVKENFDTWAYSNHQRTHLIGNLLELGKPIPRLDEVVNITLQQQKVDGSWEESEAETVWMVQVLRAVESQTNITRSLIDSAISNGLDYVKECYKTIEYAGKFYAGFLTDPSAQNISLRETAVGVWALLEPQSDVWSRWFVTLSPSLFNAQLFGSNYTIAVMSSSTIMNFDFNYSLRQISLDVTNLRSSPIIGYCNISIPKDLLRSDTFGLWSVTVDGSPTSELQIADNSTYTFLFFTYVSSAHEVAVRVIPEIPPILLIPLYMTVASLHFVLIKKVRSQHLR
jgi:hypothetical protein